MHLAMVARPAVYVALTWAAVVSAFDRLQHSGPASPYFDAPSQSGVPTATPANCQVDQAAYILRHGSRYPEPGSFAGWQNLFAKFQNATYTARGPLAFIPSWTPPVDDVPHQPLFLSATGAGEAFALGVELRKRYGLTKGGGNLTVWSASQQRCVDTASHFLRGYLSQGNYLTSPELNRGSIITLPDSVNFTFANSLTPSAACPAYNAGNTGSAKATAFRATYQAKIAQRLNRFLEGLALDAADVGVMQDLCGFLAEVDGDTRFCDVFEESEWLDYEYAHDLNYYYGSGPGNPVAAATGYPWVKAISDLFAVGPSHTTSNGTLTPPPLIMGFTHDNNLAPVVAALGLWNTSSHGVYPLSLTKPNPARTFRSSYLVAFRGYVALERLSCSRGTEIDTVKHISNQSPIAGERDAFVRVRINRAPVPIPGCSSGPGATCPLQQFLKHVEQRGIASGDFVQTCGLEGVANATSVVSFLTTAPDPASVRVLSL
ncbi:putative histidine phosphatase superfamily (branch 2) [Lyophyllum shimeji]|uniref:Histidine phosphatase superfamily (Branch 2) n=1 Tax=Lyophyllum shimeji TaxID=47721 RepID=A0A9P3ULM1_LYOSH|nr:putative histidine phosphatase superfamily (branch 2) [Lyophyllum shimeji]